jgi:hypothetical protein
MKRSRIDLYREQLLESWTADKIIPPPPQKKNKIKSKNETVTKQTKIPPFFALNYVFKD